MRIQIEAFELAGRSSLVPRDFLDDVTGSKENENSLIGKDSLVQGSNLLETFARIALLESVVCVSIIFPPIPNYGETRGKFDGAVSTEEKSTRDHRYQNSAIDDEFRA